MFVRRCPIFLLFGCFFALSALAQPIVINYQDTPQELSTTAPAQPIETSHGLEAHIHDYAKQFNIQPELIKAIIKVESNFNPLARSPKGALGLMQILPTTAAQYGRYNLFNPKDNISVGTRHFAYLLQKYQGHIPYALAAYNAGEGNVDKYGGIPPFKETRNYVLNVLRLYNHTPNTIKTPPNTTAQNPINTVDTADPAAPKRPSVILIHFAQ